MPKIFQPFIQWTNESLGMRTNQCSLSYLDSLGHYQNNGGRTARLDFLSAGPKVLPPAGSWESTRLQQTPQFSPWSTSKPFLLTPIKCQAEGVSHHVMRTYIWVHTSPMIPFFCNACVLKYLEWVLLVCTFFKKINLNHFLPYLFYTFVVPYIRLTYKYDKQSN